MVEFKCGDVVELKSGGPKMTMAEYHEKCGWFCQWFRCEELMGDTFLSDVLKLSEV